MNVENCSNCGEVIGKLEQAYAWQNHILCEQCMVKQRTRLLNPTETPTVAQRPVDVHVPTITLVKSTLIVIGVIIAVAIAFAILAGLLQYLTFHWGQFKSTGEW
jgi:hypothetical protein